MTFQKHNKIFQARFENLNLTQQKIVQHSEGPVMVIAGPGSGKTEVLAMRIVAILENTNTNPESILCITFTDSGCTAMRMRIATLVGEQIAARVSIYTFHSFCNQIIKENPEVFSLKELELVSDIEKIKIIESLTGQFKPGDPLFTVYSDILITKLQSLFQTMKNEHWTYQDIEQAVSKYLQEIPTREEFIYKRNSKDGKIGDLKEKLIQKEQEKMKALLDGSKLFEEYQMRMKKSHRYDYDDMILWVLQAFIENSEFLSQYQEKFQYICVDEFQDTNGAQFHLIELLISYWENPNIFVVGDDDQSVYRFQGANLMNIEKFFHRFGTSLATYVLDTNYRSSPDIVSAASDIIMSNEQRLSKKYPEVFPKILTPAKKKNDEIILHAWECENEDHEAVCIAQSILEDQNNGIAFENIGILYRTHAQAKALIRQFQTSGIPFYMNRSANAFEDTFVNVYLLLLEYIHSEQQKFLSGERQLFFILHNPLFGLSPLELHQLYAYVQKARKNSKKETEMTLFGFDAPTSLREVLGSEVILSSLPFLSNWNDWYQMGKKIEACFHYFHTYGVVVGLRKLVSLFDIGNTEYFSIHNIQAISATLDCFESELSKSHAITLQSVIDLLDDMKRYHIAIPYKLFCPENTVKLMTAHASKGLEFERVYLIGNTSKTWDKGQSNIRTFSFPDTLTFSTQENAEEESRRLFYVALTRAKKDLFLTTYRMNAKRKDEPASASFLEFRNFLNVQNTSFAYSQEIALLSQTTQVTQNEKLCFVPNQSWKDQIMPLLENFILSASSLNLFLRCPTSFYFEKVLKLPQIPNESLFFGSTIHAVLEYVQQELRRTQSLPVKEKVLSYYFDQMSKYQGFYSEHSFEKRRANGENILSLFYDSHIVHWKIHDEVEKKMQVEFEGVKLFGIIDRTENREQKTLIDFKTGSLKNAQSKLMPPSEKDPLGGDYWRQMAFYSLMYSLKFHTILPGEMQWVEPNEHGDFIRYPYSFSEDHMRFMQNIIREVIQKIQNFEFFPGCNDPECHWCRL